MSVVTASPPLAVNPFITAPSPPPGFNTILVAFPSPLYLNTVLTAPIHSTAVNPKLAVLHPPDHCLRIQLI